MEKTYRNGSVRRGQWCRTLHSYIGHHPEDGFYNLAKYIQYHEGHPKVYRFKNFGFLTTSNWDLHFPIYPTLQATTLLSKKTISRWNNEVLLKKFASVWIAIVLHGALIFSSAMCKLKPDNMNPLALLLQVLSGKRQRRRGVDTRICSMACGSLGFLSLARG